MDFNVVDFKIDVGNSSKILPSPVSNSNFYPRSKLDSFLVLREDRTYITLKRSFLAIFKASTLKSFYVYYYGVFLPDRRSVAST